MTDYLLGTIEIKVYEYRALNLLADSDIQCSHIKNDKDCIMFRIPLFKLSFACKVLNKEGVKYEK